MHKRRDMVEPDTTRECVEYPELCMIIRKVMRDNIREHNTLEIKTIVETGKASEKLKRTKASYTSTGKQRRKQDNQQREF